MKNFFTLMIVAGFLLVSPADALEVQSWGLPEGQAAIDFEAKNYLGEDVKLADFYEKGPVVLIFYRGGWCYYCNLQLKDIQKNLDKFNELGASVIAVSVDKQEKAAEFRDEKEFGFEIISNPEADLLEQYNLVYQVPEELAKMYKEKYNIDLEAASGRDDRVIAIPATFILDQEGIIRYGYANEDYKLRPSTEEVLAELKKLKPVE